MERQARKTPKGTPPMPTRRNTKHKRIEYGLLLMERHERRAFRRMTAVMGAQKRQ